MQDILRSICRTDNSVVPIHRMYERDDRRERSLAFQERREGESGQFNVAAELWSIPIAATDYLVEDLERVRFDL
jgi:hypothetical protein